MSKTISKLNIFLKRSGNVEVSINRSINEDIKNKEKEKHTDYK